ncbi:MAG: hypothetical protein WAM60_16285 [Candidatus Promineifilaceae bacterium]
MDISVSRLNKRMALQLPAEFPLGLVFVVGKVANLTNADGEDGRSFFYISENEHMLRCQLSERLQQEVALNEGDMIRAGGHLAFDTRQATYYLLARDIEILTDQRPSHTALAPILEDIKKRAQAANLVPADLPDWVQRIAPLEFQEKDGVGTVRNDHSNGVALTLQQVAAMDTPGAEPDDAAAVSQAEPLPVGFTDDLVRFLSEAMDSPEDVELTQEMMAELAPAIRPEPGTTTAVRPRHYDAAKAESDAQVSWTVVFVILFLLISFLGFILLMALLAAR